jgi:hypothetical protein
MLRDDRSREVLSIPFVLDRSVGTSSFHRLSVGGEIGLDIVDLVKLSSVMREPTWPTCGDIVVGLSVEYIVYMY